MYFLDDDFLTSEEINNLQKIMYKDHEVRFPWYYRDGTRTIEDKEVKFNKYIKTDSQQFVHMALSNSKKISSFSDNCFNIFNKFIEKNNIKVDEVFRIKANLILKNTDANSIHYPHIDKVKQHLVFLYYVNDSDGDTILFDKKYPYEDFNNLKIVDRVSPKAGRAIVFDGLRYHSSSSPVKNNIRCVININFTSSFSI